MSRVRIASYRRTLTAPFVCPLFDVHLDPTDFRERAPRPKTHPLETERCVKNFRFRHLPPPPSPPHSVFRLPFPRVTKTSSARKRVPLPFPLATVNTSQGGYSWRDPGNWEIEPNLARINYSSLGRIIFAFKECARGEFGCGDRIKGAGAPPYRVIECENKEVPRDVRSKRDGGGRRGGRNPFPSPPYGTITF